MAKKKGWEIEELISLAQGDGGPLPAESNDGFGLFWLGGENRMLAMDSKVLEDYSCKTVDLKWRGCEDYITGLCVCFIYELAFLCKVMYSKYYLRQPHPPNMKS